MQGIPPIPVLVFFGATASGKTGISSEIFSYKHSKNFSDNEAASELSGCAEIISADSVQVYKYLRIGSARPSEEILADLPHHLIAVKEPDEEFSAADFVSEADKLCLQIFERGKLPVLLGGTAFFLKNFMYGLPVTPKADPAVREALQKRAKKEGAKILLEELKKIDPALAERLHPNDEYRIIRALEVYASSGKPLSTFHLPDTYRKKYDFFTVSIDRPREVLYGKIEKRVDEMIAEGLIDEVKNLYAAGYTSESPALKAIGYREFFTAEHKLKRESEIPEIINSIKQNTKHYAKRQETFFKALSGVSHYNVENASSLFKLYNDILCFYKKHFKN
nr:tRNA (adenosine(37)-N6)-dimethylallyltransferase MiaA [Treponema pedis]